jgi:hypothetical protein
MVPFMVSSAATTVDRYLASLHPEQRAAITAARGAAGRRLR